MNAAPALLDADLLRRFEAILREKRIGIVDAWAPGLTDQQIDDIIAPTHLQLPEEARVWWRWHNGRRDGSPPLSWEIVPNRDLTSLGLAASAYRDAGAQDRLLQFVGEKPLLFVECRHAQAAAATVHKAGDWTMDVTPVLPSLGELVLTWISYIERGIYVVGPDGGWSPDQPSPEQRPEDVRKLGVF